MNTKHMLNYFCINTYMSTLILILPLIQHILYFVLGYQTCKILRKLKDEADLDELYTLINKKIAESELIKNADKPKIVKIDIEEEV